MGHAKLTSVFSTKNIPQFVICAKFSEQWERVVVNRRQLNTSRSLNGKLKQSTTCVVTSDTWKQNLAICYE